METDILLTHKNLVEKSKKGDRSSQYSLYMHYVDAMYATSKRLVRIKEDAEDVVQDSFVHAFKKLDTFKYESTFGSWLKRIVINKSINHLKVKRIELSPLADHEFHISEPETEAIEETDLSKIKKGIEKLPNGYRHSINLYLIEGYDHKEIGEILGITTATSKSQYHRAKKKLLKIIKEL